MGFYATNGLSMEYAQRAGGVRSTLPEPRPPLSKTGVEITRAAWNLFVFWLGVLMDL